MTTALHTAQSRYTTKHYDGQRALTDEQKATVFELLRLAPSSMNVQPWHFQVFETPEALARILPFTADFNQERVKACDMVIVLCAKSGDDLYKVSEEVFEQEKRDGRYAPGFDAQMVQDFRRHGLDLYSSGEDKGLYWAREQVNIALGFLAFGAAQAGIDSTIMGGMNFKGLAHEMGWDQEGLDAVVAIAIGRRTESDSNSERPKSRLPHEKVFTHY